MHAAAAREASKPVGPAFRVELGVWLRRYSHSIVAGGLPEMS